MSDCLPFSLSLPDFSWGKKLFSCQGSLWAGICLAANVPLLVLLGSSLAAAHRHPGLLSVAAQRPACGHMINLNWGEVRESPLCHSHAPPPCLEQRWHVDLRLPSVAQWILHSEEAGVTYTLPSTNQNQTHEQDNKPFTTQDVPSPSQSMTYFSVSPNENAEGHPPWLRSCLHDRSTRTSWTACQGQPVAVSQGPSTLLPGPSPCRAPLPFCGCFAVSLERTAVLCDITSLCLREGTIDRKAMKLCFCRSLPFQTLWRPGEEP